MPQHETHKRTLTKSITWRIVATIITFVIIIVVTKRMDLAIGVAFLDMVLKFAGYYAHERAWDRLGWGIIEPKADRSR